MDSYCRVLVHGLVAAQLGVDPESIADAQSLDGLGIDPLDLVLIVLRLEEFDRGHGDFPVGALEYVKTVGDVVAVVEGWMRRNWVPTSTRRTGT